ncbi:hypothetical protein [Methanosarcina acetivorans]|nr:hypothetical protein [Methanosarcina acetivorans]
MKNVSFLKKGFTPETDNTMEHIFSLICDIVDKAWSFKTDNGLRTYPKSAAVCYNFYIGQYATGREPGYYSLLVIFATCHYRLFG